MNDPQVHQAIVEAAGPIMGPFVREYLKAAWCEDDPDKVYVEFNLPMTVDVLAKLGKELDKAIRKVYGRKARSYMKTD